MYTFKQDDDRFVVSIDNHQELMGAIAAFCQEQGILAGEVSGIGAVNNATLRFLNPVTKHYVDKTFDEQMEISSLVGNISEKDGKVYLHLHACGRTPSHSDHQRSVRGVHQTLQLQGWQTLRRGDGT